MQWKDLLRSCSWCFIGYLQGFVCYLCNMLGILVVVGLIFFKIEFTEAVFPYVFLW